MKQEILIDRVFDAACVSIVDPEWSKQILNRVISNSPENANYANNLFNFYKTQVGLNLDYCASRRDYMIQNKEKLKLRFK